MFDQKGKSVQIYTLTSSDALVEIFSAHRKNYPSRIQKIPKMLAMLRIAIRVTIALYMRGISIEDLGLLVRALSRLIFMGLQNFYALLMY